MKIIPFIRGKIELKTSKQEFAAKVRSLTEKDLHYLEGQPFYGKKLKDYSRDSYDKYFNLWRIRESSSLNSFTKTIIHCKFIDINDKLFLSYHIRYNIFGNVFILLAIAPALYLIYDFLFISSKVDLKTLLLSLTLYPLTIWTFNDMSKDDMEFLKKLTD
jgi:hypothetical protein